MTPAREAQLAAWTTAAHYRTMPERRIVEMLMVAGWADDLARGAIDETHSRAKEVFDRCVGWGLPYRSADGVRRFDPVEVKQIAQWAAFTNGDPFWFHCARTARSRVEDFAALASAGALPVTLDLRRTFYVEPREDNPVRRFRLPLPFEDGSQRDLRVEVIDGGGLRWRPDPDRGRIEAKARAEEPFAVKVRYRFTSTQSGDIEAGDEPERYLAASEGYVQVTPAVKALAKRLTADATSPDVKIARFRDFILDELIFTPVHHDQFAFAGAVTDAVMAHARCDCHTGSALFVALCRSAAIPARMITGYLLHPEFACQHTWLEVLTDSWRPYDLAAWDLSAGGSDPAWRGVFNGRLEPRMKVECLPRRFVGPVGVDLPARWHLLSRRAGDATESSFVDVDTGVLAYRDEVTTRIGSH